MSSGTMRSGDGDIFRSDSWPLRDDRVKLLENDKSLINVSTPGEPNIRHFWLFQLFDFVSRIEKSRKNRRRFLRTYGGGGNLVQSYTDYANWRRIERRNARHIRFVSEKRKKESTSNRDLPVTFISRPTNVPVNFLFSRYKITLRYKS